MDVEQKRIGSSVVLRLRGAFDENAPDLAELLTRLVGESEADLIVDLSGVTDYRALRPLVAAERLRRDQGAMHRLAIVASAGSTAGDRLMISGMRKVIPIFASVDEVHEAWETDGFPA